MRGRCAAAHVGMHEHERADHDDRGDDHVDAERPAPRVVGGEEAADDRAERDRRARRPRPTPRTPSPVRDRGTCSRGSTASPGSSSTRRCPRSALRRRTASAPSWRSTRGAIRRRRSCAPSTNMRRWPKMSPSRPPMIEQRRERERVAGDDPLQARQLGVELAQDRRDREVQDRVVEHRDRDRHDRDRRREPAPRIELFVEQGLAIVRPIMTRPRMCERPHEQVDDGSSPFAPRALCRRPRTVVALLLRRARVHRAEGYDLDEQMLDGLDRALEVSKPGAAAVADDHERRPEDRAVALRRAACRRARRRRRAARSGSRTCRSSSTTSTGSRPSSRRSAARVLADTRAQLGYEVVFVADPDGTRVELMAPLEPANG